MKRLAFWVAVLYGLTPRLAIADGPFVAIGGALAAVVIDTPPTFAEPGDDVIRHQSAGIAEVGYGFVRHEVAIAGSLGNITYECEGSRSWSTRDWINNYGAEHTIVEYERNCRGQYNRLGLRYYYRMPITSAASVRFGFGAGWQQHTSKFEFVHDGVQTGSYKHTRTGWELGYLEVGVDWQRSEHVRFGPFIAIAVDRDDQISAHPGVFSRLRKEPRTWFHLGFKVGVQ